MNKLLLTIPIALVLSSCMNHRVNLLETNAVILQEVVPPELNINTSVYEDDGNLVVSGRLSRSSLDLRQIPGHIDIEVLSPTGEELASVKATFRSLRTWRRGPNLVAYKAELPGTPPYGSKIKIAYHVGKDFGEGTVE